MHVWYFRLNGLWGYKPRTKPLHLIKSEGWIFLFFIFFLLFLSLKDMTFDWIMGLWGLGGSVQTFKVPFLAQSCDKGGHQVTFVPCTCTKSWFLVTQSHHNVMQWVHSFWLNMMHYYSCTWVHFSSKPVYEHRTTSPSIYQMYSAVPFFHPKIGRQQTSW